MGVLVMAHHAIHKKKKNRFTSYLSSNSKILRGKPKIIKCLFKRYGRVVTIRTNYFNIKTLHFAYIIHVTSSKTSRQALWPFQPPFQCIPGFFPGDKAAGADVNHPPLSSASPKCLHGVDKDNLLLSKRVRKIA